MTAMTTATNNPTLTPAGSLLDALAARAAAALRAALVRAKARHDYRRMLELGDEHLADMGLTRGDVRSAMTGR
jgi:uncharacterized protein YjiS (DUF1127 family)